jgi:hypothetical protein
MPDERARASDYDDPMSGRLLGIAADVLRSFGSAFGGRHLAIVGGAAPALLVSEIPPGIRPHVGTADLDLHLSLHLLDGETADYYQAIIDGLRSLGLRPDTQAGREIRWRWVGRYCDAQVQVELLCPVRTRAGRPEKPAEATPAEAKRSGPPLCAATGSSTDRRAAETDQGDLEASALRAGPTSERVGHPPR